MRNRTVREYTPETKPLEIGAVNIRKNACTLLVRKNRNNADGDRNSSCVEF